MGRNSNGNLGLRNDSEKGSGGAAPDRIPKEKATVPDHRIRMRT